MNGKQSPWGYPGGRSQIHPVDRQITEQNIEVMNGMLSVISELPPEQAIFILCLCMASWFRIDQGCHNEPTSTDRDKIFSAFIAETLEKLLSNLPDATKLPGFQE